MPYRGFLPIVTSAVLVLAVVTGCSTSGTADGGAVTSLRPVTASPLAPSPTASSPSPRPATTTTPKSAETTPAPIIVPEQPGCDGFAGTNISKSKVSALLSGAQQVQEWKGLGQSRVDPRIWPVPKVVVPLSMFKAIAYLESGWRSACKGRDGIGFGLFQVSASTTDFVNQRFGENFDRMTPAGNAAVANAYLQWLIVYMGLNHFGTNFDLTKNTKFMDAVIEAFQQGQGAVLVNGKIVMNNPDYVTAVRAMMVSKPWA